MFNVTIIKLKDLLKYIAIIVAIYFFGNYIIKKEIKGVNLKEQIEFDTSKIITMGINVESTLIKNINKQEDKNLKKEQNFKISETYKKILQTGTSTFKSNFNEETVEEKIQEQPIEIQEENNNEETNIIEETQSQETEIVTKNPIKESYNKEYNGVKIKNETNFELSEDMLNSENLNINTNNIIIFHTHTCESYTQSETYQYEETGNFRTTDLNYSVARVGDELDSYLGKYGFNVHHNKTFHDYPAYTGSYTRSLSTVKGILQNFNSDIIIDLHRDAIGSNSGYAPTIKIGDDYCAQLMFVIGTNGGGLSHSNWNENLRFAIKIQQKANEIYPNFFKPIILRNSRYNQHLSKAACIIEVGSTGNTLEQAINSMKYLAMVINSSLK